MSADQTTRDLARTLIRHEVGEDASVDAVSEAAERVVARLLRYLGRWVGLDGCGVLLGRALEQAGTEFPSLGPVRLRTRTAPHLDQLATSLHGEPSLAPEAITALLAAFIDLLGDAIGAALARRLVVNAMQMEGTQTGGTNGRRHDW